MITVRHVLQEKGNSVWTVPPSMSVSDAVKLMAEKNVGALMIMNGENIAGIFSERDLTRRLVLGRKSPDTTQIGDIMTSIVITIGMNQSLDICMALMTDKHIRHLPVVEGLKLVGIISIGDVVKAVIAEKEQLIKQLESYISGGV